MADKRVVAPPEKVGLYQKLLASVEGIDTKSNFGSAYTAINGNMYTMISKHGVVGICHHWNLRFTWWLYHHVNLRFQWWPYFLASVSRRLASSQSAIA
ncbi:MAG: hypothetical protein LC739_08075 [Actinobacteria bacterium]|nr:hypothetical protein [Actinomycetota bacterium]